MDVADVLPEALLDQPSAVCSVLLVPFLTAGAVRSRPILTPRQYSNTRCIWPELGLELGHCRRLLPIPQAEGRNLLYM